VVCVVRRVLLGHGLVHTTGKVGSYLFTHPRRYECDSPTPLLGDPSGEGDPQKKTLSLSANGTYIQQVHSGSSRRRIHNKTSRRGIDVGQLVPPIIRY